MIEMIGKRFDEVVVIERVENGAISMPKFLCQCDCGETVVKFGQYLRRSPNHSCKSCNNHGKNQVNQVKHVMHGLSKHPLYQSYYRMIKRPGTKGWENVKICERYQRKPDASGLINFIADMDSTWRKGLTLDRKDNEGDYTPENTRWITIAEQNRNKSNNRCLEHVDGRQMIMADWGAELGIKRSTFRYQFKTGKHPQLKEIKYEQIQEKNK